jgi:uncharacterized RDD family membrane protein YckC
MQSAGPLAGGSGPSGPRANFGQRLVAALIDGVLLAVPYLILLAIVSEAAAYGIYLLGSVAYFSYFEGSASGQTVGKRVMNIRVIDFNTGGPIGIGRGLLRWVGRIASSIVCLLGYLWMLWDREKQTWHDKIATTVVVPTSSYPVERWPG